MLGQMRTKRSKIRGGTKFLVVQHDSEENSPYSEPSGEVELSESALGRLCCAAV